MHYVYILQSLKDDKLYIGSANDLRIRFKQHSEGKVFATKYRRPLKLIYYEAYLREYLARQREKQLKYFGKAYQSLLAKIGYHPAPFDGAGYHE